LRILDEDAAISSILQDADVAREVDNGRSRSGSNGGIGLSVVDFGIYAMPDGVSGQWWRLLMYFSPSDQTDAE
jgi:hypothetical protein